MSEFQVRVVRIGRVEKHPNSDRLEVTQVNGGYPVVFGKGEFEEGDLAVYLPIDSIVPDTEQWHFMCPFKCDEKGKIVEPRVRAYEVGEVPERHRTVTAKKLRGVFSMGMLAPLPNPPEMHTRQFDRTPYKEDDDVQDLMGVEKALTEDEVDDLPNGDGLTAKRRAYARLPWYRKPLSKIFWGRLKWGIKRKLGLVPPAFNTKIPAPAGVPEFTDIESMRKHGSLLQEGEEVVVTEKIHGANARFVKLGGQFYVGSHHHFERRPDGDEKHTVYWLAARDVEYKIGEGPEGIVWCGEVYGAVQKGFGYDAPKGDVKVRFFGAYDTVSQRYLDYDQFTDLRLQLGLESVPVLWKGPWSDKLRKLADGKSLLGDHVREGIVVTPVVERWDRRCGRVILKLVSQDYLLLKGK